MSKRRMFSPDIVLSDAFTDMPASTQTLYYSLGMFADDDGFVASPKRVMRMIGSNEDDFKILISKRFLLTFPNGIVAIKHWRINNYIRKDRYTKTKHLDCYQMLRVKENMAYTLDENQGLPVDEVPWKSDTSSKKQSGIPDGIPVVDTGKVRVGKVRVESKRQRTLAEKEKRKVAYGEFKNVRLTDEEKEKLKDLYGPSVAKSYVEKLGRWKKSTGKKKKDDYATIRSWLDRDGVPQEKKKPYTAVDSETKLTPVQQEKIAEKRKQVAESLRKRT